jgi:NAD(P)-dependent dehydrogenase (short-subunit alcohol dehydrogenase family)/uncharacterized OB-fold protein
MTPPLTRPPRKNPILRTRVPALPPASRSRVAMGLTAAAARGAFELQQCRDCQTVQYPPREACHACLSARLDWRPQDPTGELIAESTLHHSLENFFRERAPWRVGIVHLNCGVNIVTHLHGDCAPAPSPVRVSMSIDRAGQAAMIALPPTETENMADDRQFRELTCDPKFRKVLVTDAKSAVGQALVRGFVEAGADIVWAGVAEPWKSPPGFDALAALPAVTLVPLDLSDARSVQKIGGELAGKIDILVNSAEVHRPYSISGRTGTDVARLEMEINYLGLLRLAQEFGPAMKARAADGDTSAVAWVNILSIYALSNFPAHGTYAASMAAAHALALSIRADFGGAGLRVLNIFPGPVDDEWNQSLLPPKIAPVRLAESVIGALRRGLEDVYPDPVAQQFFERWRDNPKALERELAGQPG